jgi:hypothetical protein
MLTDSVPGHHVFNHLQAFSSLLPFHFVPIPSRWLARFCLAGMDRLRGFDPHLTQISKQVGNRIPAARILIASTAGGSPRGGEGVAGTNGTTSNRFSCRNPCPQCRSVIENAFCRGTPLLLDFRWVLSCAPSMARPRKRSTEQNDGQPKAQRPAKEQKTQIKSHVKRGLRRKSQPMC